MKIIHHIKSLLAFLLWPPWGFGMMINYMVEDGDIEVK